VVGNDGIPCRAESSVTATALVTGAYGFIGARLCKLLVERGWRVVAGHRRRVSLPDVQGAVSACLPAYLPLCAEQDRWSRSLQSVDCVVHLAAHVHQTRARRDDPRAYEKINVEGSRFVAEQAARARVKRFVFLSSAKVNGEDSNGGLFQADGPMQPQDAYARSKASAERIIRDVCERASMEFVIVRPPLVYGPGVRANFHRLLRLADLGWPLPLGSIANRRSLVAVENLADFIATCMVHPHAPGRVWLVSDGEDLSTPELIRRIARCMRRPARLFNFSPVLLTRIAKLVGWGGEAARLCDSLVLDVRPALQLLNWRAPKGLDDGLQETVADYLGRRRN